MAHEDSEENNLGELPQSLRYERGEFFGRRPANNRGVPGQTPGGFPAESFDQQGPPPPPPIYPGDLNSPPPVQDDVQYPDVTVTYPALPVSAVGFQFQGMAYVGPISGGNYKLSDVSQFRVPPGYVAVIRNLKWEVQNPQNPGVDLADFNAGEVDSVVYKMRPVLNGGSTQFPRSAIFATDSSVSPPERQVDLDFWFQQFGDVPVYILGRENDVIGMSIELASTKTDGDTYFSYIYVEMTGELLVDKGKQLPFEPSNREG